MKDHKSLTLYKNGSCDLGPEYAVRVCNRNKAESWPGQGHARVRPELGWARSGPGLG
jgi:hypothetical protein